MKKTINRKAHFDYNLFDRLETGIVLTGGEVKSIKGGRISLDESFVRVKYLELYLVNAHIPPYEAGRQDNYDPTRQRKLLAHKNQILSLSKKIEGKGYTLVATAIYQKKGKIKVEIALAKGKKQYEKREIIKRRDQVREMERAIRGKS